MSGKVALLTPNIGLPSETFIRRHVEFLSADNKVVVTHNILPSEEGTWGVDCPVHVIRSGGLFSRGARFLRSKVEPDAPVYVDAEQVRRFLAEHQVDTLWGHFANYSWPFFQIAQELGLHFFIHCLGYDLSKVYRDPQWRRRYADYRDATGLIVLNKAMRERLLAVGIPEEKIHIIPCGVEVPENRVEREASGRVRYLAVGRMVGKKAPLKLLEAFRLACREVPDLHLDYVGNGPLFPDVQTYIRTHDLHGSITLHGGQPHRTVIEMMKKSDVFLQHSLVDPKTGDEEGMPVGILEALAQGLPVVSTRHAGIPEAVLDGMTGFVVEEGDSGAMARRIVELASDRAKRTAMGERAWTNTRANFSCQSEKEKLSELMGLNGGTPFEVCK